LNGLLTNCTAGGHECEVRRAKKASTPRGQRRLVVVVILQNPSPTRQRPNARVSTARRRASQFMLFASGPSSQCGYPLVPARASQPLYKMDVSWVSMQSCAPLARQPCCSDFNETHRSPPCWNTLSRRIWKGVFARRLCDSSRDHLKGRLEAVLEFVSTTISRSNSRSVSRQGSSPGAVSRGRRDGPSKRPSRGPFRRRSESRFEAIKKTAERAVERPSRKPSKNSSRRPLRRPSPDRLQGRFEGRLEVVLRPFPKVCNEDRLEGRL
jgi:hypothetical protein